MGAIFDQLLLENLRKQWLYLQQAIDSRQANMLLFAGGHLSNGCCGFCYDWSFMNNWLYIMCDVENNARFNDRVSH